MSIQIEWTDAGREAQFPSSPLYPDGIDLDLARGQQSCTVQLPYPAPRCGHYLVACSTCGLRLIVTTAGRADDPRSLRMACKTP